MRSNRGGVFSVAAFGGQHLRVEEAREPGDEHVEHDADDDLVDEVLDRERREHERRPARPATIAASRPSSGCPVSDADERRGEGAGEQLALDGDVDHAGALARSRRRARRRSAGRLSADATRRAGPGTGIVRAGRGPGEEADQEQRRRRRSISHSGDARVRRGARNAAAARRAASRMTGDARSGRRGRARSSAGSWIEVGWRSRAGTCVVAARGASATNRMQREHGEDAERDRRLPAADDRGLEDDRRAVSAADVVDASSLGHHRLRLPLGLRRLDGRRAPARQAEDRAHQRRRGDEQHDERLHDQDDVDRDALGRPASRSRRP